MTKPGKEINYVVRITRWDWRYSLGISHRPDDDPISEYRHLTLFGELLAPKLPKVHEVEIILIPDRDMEKVSRGADRPSEVGRMRTHRGILELIQGIPADILPSILVALSSRHFRYAHLIGFPLRYRQATITNFSLGATLDDDMLMPD
jgi:hypothetical protein